MKGFVSDHDIEGHFHRLFEFVARSQAVEIWDNMELEVLTFRDLGWDFNSSDRDIWRRCQLRELILITNNRNQEDETSLEATIRAELESDHLPVITLGDIKRFEHERGYAERVAEAVIELAFDVLN